MRVPLRGNSWRLLLPAALLLAVLCVVASAPAKDLEEKLSATQGKLSHVRESQSALAATIAEQNKAIDSMIGEVSDLRQQQAAVESELAAKQDELDTATAKLAADKHHLGRGPRPPAARARRPAPAPRRDLRVGQPRHAQRRPRLGQLVGSDHPRRLPRARSRNTTTRSPRGSRACATKRAPRSSG